MPQWPQWWNWELELSPHLLKHMIDRRFNEVDLRAMLAEASDYHQDEEVGRWVIETIHDGSDWEVIVEPSESERVLIVVTAYAVG